MKASQLVWNPLQQVSDNIDNKYPSTAAIDLFQLTIDAVNNLIILLSSL